MLDINNTTQNFQTDDFISISLDLIEENPTLKFFWNLATFITSFSFVGGVFYVFYMNCFVPCKGRLHTASITESAELTSAKDSNLLPLKDSAIKSSSKEESKVIETAL